jgi:competence protein ComEC
MTLAAQVMVAPLLIYYFKQFSTVSLLANLLVLPLMPLTMLFGFLSGLGGLLFLPLGKAFGLVTWLLSLYQLSVIKWLGGLSWSSVQVSISWIVLLVVYILFICGILYFRKNIFANEEL